MAPHPVLQAIIDFTAGAVGRLLQCVWHCFRCFNAGIVFFLCTRIHGDLITISVNMVINMILLPL